MNYRFIKNIEVLGELHHMTSWINGPKNTNMIYLYSETYKFRNVYI